MREQGDAWRVRPPDPGWCASVPARSTASSASRPGAPRAVVLLLPGERPARLPHLVHRYRTNRVPQSIAPTPSRPASTEQDCIRSAGRVKLRGGWLDGQTLSAPLTLPFCCMFLGNCNIWGAGLTLLSRSDSSLSASGGWVHGHHPHWANANSACPPGMLGSPCPPRCLHPVGPTPLPSSCCLQVPLPCPPNASQQKGLWQRFCLPGRRPRVGWRKEPSPHHVSALSWPRRSQRG